MKKLNSAIIAKLLVRIFFLFLVAAMFGIVKYQDKLKVLGSIRLDQWRLIFPALLIIGFIVLLVLASIKKYKVGDINLLLIVNTIMLLIYGLAIFIRVAALVG
ncbi:hypothetical protein KHS38_06295 [Mucilaginibacter sp. Bleaf8]|uniref:hypothetical protein n=1 Tax=Mucilaginibacter sp. Bleaf8 TaxID=2834430 RepID=UPI001BCB23A5|nr:hypothetical protein [Mucilaginibacter sp. Bleaf8]MBS7564010.1 hypothetical protein [Mucilaginibacter sp. Bleaf8]